MSSTSSPRSAIAGALQKSACRGRGQVGNDPGAPQLIPKSGLCRSGLCRPDPVDRRTDALPSSNSGVGPCHERQDGMLWKQSQGQPTADPGRRASRRQDPVEPIHAVRQAGHGLRRKALSRSAPCCRGRARSGARWFGERWLGSTPGSIPGASSGKSSGHNNQRVSTNSIRVCCCAVRTCRGRCMARPADRSSREACGRN